MRVGEPLACVTGLLTMLASALRRSHRAAIRGGFTGAAYRALFCILNHCAIKAPQMGNTAK